MSKNIKRNISKQSLKDIVRLNILVTNFVLLCSLFFLLLFENRKVVVIMTIKSALYVLITSFSLMHIMKYCVLKFHDNILLYRFYKYLSSYIVGISLYLLFWHIFASYAGIIQRTNDTKWLMVYTMIAIIFTTILLMLQDFVVTRRLKIETELEYSRLQTKNKEAENLVLKQQIQPHFLFNSLSTLKSLISTDTEKSQTYLIHLAEFLRVAVSHHKTFTATLEEELSVCVNYLEMQKIRFGAALEWEIAIENTQMLSGYVPFLSLQPLIENAIKHNILTRSCPLKVNILQMGKSIEVLNNINSKKYGESSTKSGLANLAERYFLMTGEYISMNNDGKTFSVRFNIISNESTNY